VIDHSQLSSHFSTFTLLSSELLSTSGGLMGCPEFLLTTSATLAILNHVAKWLKLLCILEILGSNFVSEIGPPD
jgi:hypothetical protein